MWNLYFYQNVIFQKLVVFVGKYNDFALQSRPKTSQDASQMAFGPLLNRSWPLLLALGPLLAALASILVRLEPLLAALGSLLAPLGSLLGRSCPLQGRTRPAAPKFPQPALTRQETPQSFFAIYRSNDGISSALLTFRSSPSSQGKRIVAKSVLAALGLVLRVSVEPWPLLGHSWAILRSFWTTPGHSWAAPGRSGAALGCS